MSRRNARPRPAAAADRPSLEAGPAPEAPGPERPGASGALSATDAAQRCGCDRGLLRRLAAQGRIRRRADGRYDLAELDADWRRYLETRRPKVDGLRVDGSQRAAPGDDEAGDVRCMSYRGARAHRERFAALAAELDYEARAAQLTDRDTLRRQWLRESRRARDELEAMVDRLAPVLVAIDDLHEARRAIALEVRRVCESLSRPAERV